MCCTRLDENTGRKNDAKIAIWAPSRNFVGLNFLHVSSIGKKNLLNSNISSIRPHNMANFGSLAADGCLGHPSKFQRVSRLGFVTAAMSLIGGQPNLARCLAVSWAGTLYKLIHFRGLLPPDGILPVAKLSLRPSLAFSYIGSGTARQSSIERQPNFAAWYKEWNY